MIQEEDYFDSIQQYEQAKRLEWLRILSDLYAVFIFIILGAWMVTGIFYYVPIVIIAFVGMVAVAPETWYDPGDLHKQKIRWAEYTFAKKAYRIARKNAWARKYT